MYGEQAAARRSEPSVFDHVDGLIQIAMSPPPSTTASKQSHKSEDNRINGLWKGHTYSVVVSTLPIVHCANPNHIYMLAALENICGCHRFQ